MLQYVIAVLVMATMASANPHPTHHPHHPTHAPTNETLEVCWRDAYCRGEGHFPKECDNGFEFDHGRCYKECEANFTGEGPFCWEHCPEGFHDSGPICMTKPHFYNPCPPHDPCGRKTPECRGNCTEGYRPVGCSCYKPGKTIHKKSYKRQSGKGPYCPSNETESFGLCFEACKDGYIGLGPVCWRNDSGNPSYTVECNPFAFGQNATDCKELNRLLWKAGYTTPFCIGPLAVSIITGHVVGPHMCRKLILEVLPVLGKTPQC